MFRLCGHLWCLWCMCGHCEFVFNAIAVHHCLPIPNWIFTVGSRRRSFRSVLQFSREFSDVFALGTDPYEEQHVGGFVPGSLTIQASRCSCQNEDSEAAWLKLQIQEHVEAKHHTCSNSGREELFLLPKRPLRLRSFMKLLNLRHIGFHMFPCSCRYTCINPHGLLHLGEIRTVAADVLQGADFALGDAVEFDNAGAITDGRVVLLEEDQAGTSREPSLCLKFCGHCSFWTFGGEPPSGSKWLIVDRCGNSPWHRLWCARLWMGVSESSSIGIFFLQGRDRLVEKVTAFELQWKWTLLQLTRLGNKKCRVCFEMLFLSTCLKLGTTIHLLTLLGDPCKITSSQFPAHQCRECMQTLQCRLWHIIVPCLALHMMQEL